MNGCGTKRCIKSELFSSLGQHYQWVVPLALQVGSPTSPPLSPRLPWLPLPPRGGAELENLPRGQDWRRYWVAWTAGALSALFLHLHRLVLHLYHVRLSSLLRGNVVKWSGELISSRASGTIATSPSASATRSFSWAWFQSAGWRCCMLVLLLVTVFTCLRTL